MTMPVQEPMASCKLPQCQCVGRLLTAGPYLELQEARLETAKGACPVLVHAAYAYDYAYAHVCQVRAVVVRVSPAIFVETVEGVSPGGEGNGEIHSIRVADSEIANLYELIAEVHA